MEIDSKFVYTISFSEIEKIKLEKELYKLDFKTNPTLEILYQKLIRA